MKIGVASIGKEVSEHFGHCEAFLICSVEDSSIVDCETIKNPGHKPGYLPEFLDELGVKVIISGGMGEGALNIFQSKKIDVITGATGDAFEAAQKYLIGELKTDRVVCNKHQHHEECGH